MAAQHFVAYSASCKGAGIVGGSPYGCPSIAEPVKSCAHYNQNRWSKAGGLQGLWSYTANKGNKIDSTSNLKKSKLYLFQGTNDRVVDMKIMTETRDYFKHYLGSANIKSKFDIPASHAWVVGDRTHGNKCDQSGKPMIQHCNYDMAGEILSWVGAGSKAKVKSNNKHIYEIDQRKYAPSGQTASRISMANFGYAYVPSKCRSNPSSCAIHVAYHGCVQSVSYIGMTFVQESGLNEHAEANGIVVIYPQSYNNLKLGLNYNTACWDWLGKYGAGPHFDEKRGYQLEAVINMVKDYANIAKLSSAYSARSPPANSTMA